LMVARPTLFRLQLTIRRLAIVVAVAAVVFWGERMRQRRAYFRQAADLHVGREYYLRAVAVGEVRGTGLEPASALSLADYHARMKRKYLRAASHPWRTIAPDPPEPVLRKTEMEAERALREAGEAWKR
jgi:hypothetical protein